MSDLLERQNSKLDVILKKLGYVCEKPQLLVSSRKDLGEYQFNGTMELAKKYKKNPIEIAKEIQKELLLSGDYESINIAGPGFINITLSRKLLLDYIAEIEKDISINIRKNQQKKIVIDYGGPNVAKTLHVGHLRSANLGEALKRLAKKMNCKVIADVHLGDWGRQMGLIILELKKRHPNWVYFDENYKGEYPQECPISNQELEELYPISSKKAKEDENYLKDAREITAKLQKKVPGYYALWKKIVEISVNDIKKIYKNLDVSFDLWEGESDAQEYIPDIIKILKAKKLIYESDGALVVDVSESNDKIKIPPLIVVKSNGAISYEATDLATLYERVNKLNPDEIWYIVDKRQELHFTQVFRVAKKAGIVPENVDLKFIGFGTMNGKDGRPFKTRDGNVMSLSMLIDAVKQETLKRLNPNIKEEEKEEISNIITMASLKYADLLPNRTTDYIFDPEKFCEMEGKTGTYLLYSTIRIRSLLNKAKERKIPIGPIKKLINDYDINIALNLLQMPIVLEKAYNDKTLNDIAEYLFQLTNCYNTFYETYKILNEKDEITRSSWLGLSETVLNANTEMLNILGMKPPKKM